jgi:DNA-binding FrmR family transcriptional regulator
MAFRAESLDFISNLDTLWAVVAGAILATTGGFVATQLEHRIDTRRREREAALFFGELMSMVRVTAESAKRAKGIGDPYGPVTMRLLRLVRRELDVYDRNRERLFELKDPTMRAHIHTVLLRTIMGVEGTIEAAEDCIEIATELASNPDMAAARREVMEKKLAEQSQRRDLSFEFLDEMSEQAVGLAKRLEPIARVDFDAMIQATKDV